MFTVSARAIDQVLQVNRKRLARFRLVVKDVNGNPEDVTGDTFTATVTDGLGGATKFSGVCSVVDAVNGEVSVTFSAANNTDGASGATITTYYYVIDRTHLGETFPIFAGQYEIHPLATN